MEPGEQLTFWLADMANSDRITGLVTDNQIAMKIIIDSSPLRNTLTGVGQYTRYLIENLAEIDKKNSYTLFNVSQQDKAWRNILAPRSNISYKTVCSTRLRSLCYRAVRKLFGAPIDLFVEPFTKNKIFFFPNYLQLPLRKNVKSIIVIHDLSFIFQRQYVHESNQKYLESNLMHSVKNASHICADSEHTKKEILQHYKIDENKISVITPAISHQTFNAIPQHDDQAIVKQYQLTKPYILFTGTLEPRKNIIGLLNAYENLPAHLQQEYTLVLVGGKGWLDEEIHHKISELNHLDIKCTGYVPDEHLPALYRQASLFVYPSFYEGFGLPPLEAMACGTPVISSNTSAIPEVVGSAGILIDPHQPQQLTKAISSVLSDANLAAKMREQGLIQAQQFCWKKSAQQLLQLFQAIA